MDPLVEAAWIAAAATLVGVGGTVAVAVVGFRSTRAATADTLKAARDDRLWDKRAQAYVDVYGALGPYDSLLVAAKQHLEGGPLDEARLRRVKDELGRIDGDSIDARLEAFGSHGVYMGFSAAYELSAAAALAYFSWADSPSEAGMAEALRAIEAADGAAGAVRRAVRGELIGDMTPLAVEETQGAGSDQPDGPGPSAPPDDAEPDGPKPSAQSDHADA